MERRVLVAVFLSFLVLYGYQTFILPPPPPPQPQAETSASAPGTATATGTAQESPAIPPSPQATPAADAVATDEPEAATVVIGEDAEREIVVETATVDGRLSNRGARILHWRLKAYRDDLDQPVDLVPSDLPPGSATPFALQVDDPAITERLNTALYRVIGDRAGRVDAQTGEASVLFEFEDASGLRARKEFRFDPRNYLIAFSATVENGGVRLNPSVLWGAGLEDSGAQSGGGSFFTGNYVQPPQGIYHLDGSVERLTAGDLQEQPIHNGPFRFVGIDDHYFIAAALNTGQTRIEFQPTPLAGPDDTQRVFVSQAFTFPDAPDNVQFFYGPKQLDLLRSVDTELVRAINFGIFGWLAVPLLGALQWIYGFAGNYGWSIVLLTLCINLTISPLRHKSVVSMRKMQAVQPQMKAIQDRYAGLKKTDPARQKMNTEIMALYKEKGVNPASGCLPMLLQFPVLLAFYSMLGQSIELRGADFGFWIHDLSQPDPYYIIPVLMAGTMFWQTKITPSTADPAQQKIMMLMPLMFTFFFLQAPSGLVVYWFVSNLWAIGQQYFTLWMIGPVIMATVRPPAERRLKNAGAGKTPGAGKRS
ncbi:MAG: membrane protein insertase YidC [Acidobacteria bacterium]|nr:membrane protein insertase YidC [Acidobacteriota bacterium]